jgi:RHS repeat-associated protein
MIAALPVARATARAKRHAACFLLALAGMTAQAQTAVPAGKALPPGAPIPGVVQPSPVTLSVNYYPMPMVAGQAWNVNWSSSKASTVRFSCTAAGTGYKASGAVALSGSMSGTASAAWVGYPSTCIWTARGQGGTATFSETMTTTAPPAPGDVVTYIHTDGLGSPVARSDQNGALVSTTRYEPYGLTAGGVVPTIGFTGHVNDADTGLVYMQQRYYDPVAGRFLTGDPVTTNANTGGSFNRYAYANNSPYKYIDPDGRDSEVTWNSAGTAVNIKIPFAISDPAGVARFTPSQVATEVGNRLSGNVAIGGVVVTVTTVGVPVPLDSPSVANGSANVVTVRPALGRSSTNKIGGNKINLRGTADAKVVTHELAHSAKAGDHTLEVLMQPER